MCMCVSLPLSLYVSMCVCMCIYTYMCLCVSLCVSLWIFLCLYLSVSVFLSLSLPLWAWLWVCMHTYVLRVPQHNWGSLHESVLSCCWDSGNKLRLSGSCCMCFYHLRHLSAPLPVMKLLYHWATNTQSSALSDLVSRPGVVPIFGFTSSEHLLLWF